MPPLIQRRWIGTKTLPRPADRTGKGVRGNQAAANFISLIASELLTAPPTRLVA